jgi:hypothetical protein
MLILNNIKVNIKVYIFIIKLILILFVVKIGTAMRKIGNFCK